jgi:hypothetical protein
LELFGSIAIPVACVWSTGNTSLSAPVTSVHSPPLGVVLVTERFAWVVLLTAKATVPARLLIATVHAIASFVGANSISSSEQVSSPVPHDSPPPMPLLVRFCVLCNVQLCIPLVETYTLWAPNSTR